MKLKLHANGSLHNAYQAVYYSTVTVKPHNVVIKTDYFTFNLSQQAWFRSISELDGGNIPTQYSENWPQYVDMLCSDDGYSGYVQHVVQCTQSVLSSDQHSWVAADWSHYKYHLKLLNNYIKHFTLLSFSNHFIYQITTKLVINNTQVLKSLRDSFQNNKRVCTIHSGGIYSP